MKRLLVVCMLMITTACAPDESKEQKIPDESSSTGGEQTMPAAIPSAQESAQESPQESAQGSPIKVASKVVRKVPRKVP